MSGARPSPVVDAARQRLAEGRRKLQKQHDSGSPGVQVCTRLADLLDFVILDFYQSILEELGQPAVQNQIALVPHGGYGRRDVAPYSDVDLMLLCQPEAVEAVLPLARRLTQHICDSGLTLGYSLRTPAQAWQLAMKDATVFTSLAEARYLGGSLRLFAKFAKQLRRQAQRRCQSLISRIEAARAKEEQQFGDTSYLLRPNLKKTRGGLRDLQMIRWVGFARYGEADPGSLQRRGELLEEDYRVLRDARDYLLRLRNELHFHAGREQDVLDKQEQLRLAERGGFYGEQALRPVEQFMRRHFEHTSEVAYRVEYFVAGAKRRTAATVVLGWLFSSRMEDAYWIGPVHIGATAKGLSVVTADLERVLHLMDLANKFDKRIDHRTWEAIRKAMVEQPPTLTLKAADSFMSLMSGSHRLAALLRRLHQLRALDILVPPMAHARCLMQFNDYHKYTVDEHSLRAVDFAAKLDGRLDTSLGRAYHVSDKKILHLAILMHDLGKGFPEDHSLLGAKLGRETAQRLGLDADQTETLAFLIRKHLRMANLAFRHDLNDESVIVNFAVEVGRLDWLRMLFVLTCADLDAVGPDVLNRWKLELLTQLYHRTRARLADDNSQDFAAEREKRRKAVLGRAPAEFAERWQHDFDSLPWNYIESRSDAQVLEELQRLQQVSQQGAVAWGVYLDKRQAVEYTIGTEARHAHGAFHRLTGSLSSQGHQILAAEIHTMHGRMVLNRFHVQDLDFSEEPPQERLAEVAQKLVQAVQNELDEPPKFRRYWRSADDQPRLSQLPTQVQTDNRTSDNFTIVSVFTYNRLGLLYSLARTLFDLGLQVRSAKISTHLDQVVDVFYVTDHDGRKITDRTRLAAVRDQVVAQVEALEAASQQAVEAPSQPSPPATQQPASEA